MDQLIDLATQLGEAAQQKKQLIVTAESCTGGLVAQLLTSVAGSSAWFDCGLITYSNPSKTALLGVLPATLDTFGAVSEETVSEMALGALACSRADIAASISGIAGPSGGTQEKPVGTVCFAWAHKNGTLIKVTQQFEGDRQEVRKQAAMYSILGLLEQLSLEQAS